MLASNPVKRYSVLDSALAAISGWIQKRKLIRDCRQRFEACTSDEIARLAHDVGLPETDLRRMATLGPDAAKQLLDRMTALHLDAEVIANSEPGTMRDMQRLCSNCVSKKRCQRDLGTESERSSVAVLSERRHTRLAERRVYGRGLAALTSPFALQPARTRLT